VRYFSHNFYPLGRAFKDLSTTQKRERAQAEHTEKKGMTNINRKRFRNKFSQNNSSDADANKG
jgi:hypothetical protein